MQDMDEDYRFGLDAVEDQVVAMNALTNTIVLQAGTEAKLFRALGRPRTCSAALRRMTGSSGIVFSDNRI
nr:hypothetical protein REQ54_03961 [Rhizobium sp. Q54]